MLKKIVSILTIAASTAFASTAFADGDEPMTPDTTPPKCEADAQCKKALEECQTSLKTSTDAAKDLTTKLEVCEGKLKGALPPIPPPVKHDIKCVGEGIESDGAGGCKCTDSRYVAVVLKSFQEMTCVTPWTVGHQLEMDVQALKDLMKRMGMGDDVDLQALIVKVNELYEHKDDWKAKYELVMAEFVKLDQRVRLIEENLEAVMGAYCPVIEGNETATMAERCQAEHDKLAAGLNQAKWTTGADLSIGALVLPGAGAQGIATIGWTNTVYFGSTTPVGLKLKLEVGRGFGNDGLAGNWVWGAKLGPVFNLYQRYVELGVFGYGQQVISDHGAGYQGVLNDPGLGFIAGGMAELNFNFAHYLDAGLAGGVGFAQANWFEGPKDLRQETGVGGTFMAHFGVHTDVVPF